MYLFKHGESLTFLEHGILKVLDLLLHGRELPLNRHNVILLLMHLHDRRLQRLDYETPGFGLHIQTVQFKDYQGNI